MATCKVGSAAAVDFTFTALDTGVLTDPTTVSVFLRKPDLSEEVYTYPDDPEITRSSVGSYRFRRVWTEPRRSIIRPVGTGAVNRAEEVFMDVEESYFLDPMP